MKCGKSCVMQAKGEGIFDLQEFLLAAFAKIVKSNYLRCYVHLLTWNNLAPTGQIFMKFDTDYF